MLAVMLTTLLPGLRSRFGIVRVPTSTSPTKFVKVTFPCYIGERQIWKDGTVTYVVKGEDRSVGNNGCTVKVGLIRTIAETNVAIRDLGSSEVVKSLELNCLLEGDAVLARQTTWLDLCLAIDSDTQRFVVVEPDVESSKLLHVGDFDVLGDVHDLVFVAVGLGHVHCREWYMCWPVLEIHFGLKWIN